jgi:CHAT domain-containing protein
VILSACNTAGGAGESAEVLSGMARAFFYAGSRALLVSHWEVGSDAAVKLTMRAFAELKSNPGIGRAQAFRISMRALIEKGSPAEATPRCGLRSWWWRRTVALGRPLSRSRRRRGLAGAGRATAPAARIIPSTSANHSLGMKVAVVSSSGLQRMPSFRRRSR